MRKELGDAIDVFCHAATGEIMRLIGIMEGIDAIVFSGGIGENSHQIRKKLLAKLEFLGMNANSKENERIGGKAKAEINGSLSKPTIGNRTNKGNKISDDNSTIGAYVIKVDEEMIIAKRVVESQARQ